MSNLHRMDFTNQQRIPDKPAGQVARLENGFLRLANQIQDALCKVELSGREFRVLNAIIRLTYGWSKKEDRITNSLIADTTDLSIKHASEAVNNLAGRNILTLRRIGQTRYIGINTGLDKWAVKKSVLLSATPENGKSKKRCETLPENRHNPPRNQGELSPKTGNTKDIIPETDKNITSPEPSGGKATQFDPLSIPVPEWLNRQAWQEWIQYRQEAKKPVRTELTVTKIFNLLKECLDEGHDPAEVINASIANGYQGLFKPKFPVRKPQPTALQPAQHWNSREAWENEFL